MESSEVITYHSPMSFKIPMQTIVDYNKLLSRDIRHALVMQYIEKTRVATESIASRFESFADE